MRIFHAIPTMLGGGAERQLCYLAEGLTSLGHEVHVAYLRDGPFSDRLASSGAILHRLGDRKRLDYRLPLDIRRLILQTKPGLVQTWLTRMDMLAGAAAISTRTPFVYSERTVWKTPDSIAERVRDKLAARATAVIANSEEGARRWRGLGRPVFVVPNAVPVSEIRTVAPATRSTLPIPESAPLFYLPVDSIPTRTSRYLGTRWCACSLPGKTCTRCAVEMVLYLIRFVPRSRAPDWLTAA